MDKTVPSSLSFLSPFGPFGIMIILNLFSTSCHFQQQSQIWCEGCASKPRPAGEKMLNHCRGSKRLHAESKRASRGRKPLHDPFNHGTFHYPSFSLDESVAFDWKWRSREAKTHVTVTPRNQQSRTTTSCENDYDYSDGYQRQPWQAHQPKNVRELHVWRTTDAV